MNMLLAVAAGGAIGSVGRYLFAGWVMRAVGAPGGFPWGTLAVNVVGGFVMGLIVELLARRGGVAEEVRAFLAVGVMGGFTTFSSFSLEVVLLWQRGDAAQAAAYIAASVVFAVGGLLLGLQAVKAFA
jgi:CrcB protein